MEDEPVIVSDWEFEWLASHPESELDETGELLIRTDSGVKQSFMRQRDWEKTQEPFGFEAQAGRERIEKARRFRYEETDSVESALCGHEYALLRNATSTELETYVAAEEAMRVCQLKQRGIIKAAGIRGKVWEDEETGEAFLHAQLDNSSYEFHRNWPDWDAVGEALEDEEISLLEGLYEQINAAAFTQIDVSQMAIARYIDSHPEKYPCPWIRVGTDNSSSLRAAGRACLSSA
jgi:hypothetical protein